MISRRYNDMVANEGVAGKLAKVDCLIHVDSEVVRAHWDIAGWGGQWYTPGNGTYMCTSVIDWAFVSFVECRQPQVTLYNRSASERSGRFQRRYCTMCGYGSSAGWQICVHRTSAGTCLAPLTKAGAHEILTAAKSTALYEVTKFVMQGGQVSIRYGQAGGKEPRPSWCNQVTKKRVTRARNLGFYSHYARYQFDDRCRQDCVTNGVDQKLYLQHREPRRGRMWYEPAESFEIPEEVAQNGGKVLGADRHASRKGDEEGPDSRWSPTEEGRAIFEEARPRPLGLREHPDTAQEGRSSRRERSERRRADSRSSYHRAGWKPHWKKK